MDNRKLLILDNDETLTHTIHLPDSPYVDQIASDEFSYDFKFTLREGAWSSPKHRYFTKKRPFLKEFMDYAFDNFRVAIWTAADMDYARTIMNNCNIPSSKLLFFWAKDMCAIKEYNDGGYYGEKNIKKIRRSFGIDLKDILIVDDVAETAVDNPDNLIKINPFRYQSNDTELLKLMSYLEKIKELPDFRKVEKRGWSNKS